MIDCRVLVTAQEREHGVPGNREDELPTGQPAGNGSSDGGRWQKR
jgi:hypothetical protein